MDDELKEEDFIKKEDWKSPNPFLLGIFFLAVGLIILSGLLSWLNEKKAEQFQNPFYQVTNRDFTLFLRANPRFLNENVSSKEAYLPGLKYIENISSEKESADLPVDAPPNVLFQYHTWKRLIDYPQIKRAIPLDQFKEFLKTYPEWTPEYWKKAPKNYADLIESINKGATPDHLEDVLPGDVQKAFIGWKNFSLEKDEMEKFTATYEQLGEFLKKYPNYARNYWINIIRDSDPKYLETFSFGKPDTASKVPDEETTQFIEIALFNYSKSQNHPQKQAPSVQQPAHS